MIPKFNFVDPAVLSYADVQRRVKADLSFPENRRAEVITNLNRAFEWYKLTAGSSAVLLTLQAEHLPFDGATLKAMFMKFVPRLLGVSEKSVQNAKAALNFVTKFYGISRRPTFAPLTDEMLAACQAVRSQFDRYEVSRFLHFSAARGIRLGEVDQLAFAEFCEALKADWTIKDPEAIGARTRRTWNRLSREYPTWPQVQLAGAKRKERWGLPFCSFSAVEREALAFLRRGLDAQEDWDGPDAEAPELRPATILTQMQQYRIAASSLAHSGVPVSEITGLRALCVPEHFTRLMKCYVAHLGRHNRSVELLADVLLKTARYAGVLEPSEIKAVEELHAKLSKRIAKFEETKESKGEKLLAQFDDERVMDAFITLPHHTVAAVLKSGRQGRMAAYSIQKALILELWLCAPLRLSNLLSLRIDKNFFRITLDGVEHVVLRIPAEATKNRRELEHLLHDAAAALLRDYIDFWRPIIAKSESPYLFPGAAGGVKAKQVLATQMRKYIWKGCGVRFHPHLVRRVVAKLILDDETGNLETARRQLGHADMRMLLNVYAQRQNRTVQKRYLGALQARRLSAIERLDTRRPLHEA